MQIGVLVVRRWREIWASLSKLMAIALILLCSTLTIPNGYLKCCATAWMAFLTLSLWTAQGDAIAQSIGEQPKGILEQDLDALIANNPIPYANKTGQVSQFEPQVKVTDDTNTDPRNHGG